MSSSETYLFMSHPRAVETRRKYRDPNEMEEELGNTANIMFDPRVVRGVTCGRPMPMHAMQPDGEVETAKRPSKRALMRQGHLRPTQKSVAEIHENIKVERKRVEVPLHLYLIEQEEVTPTVTVSSQTDAFLEEPPSPKFIPRKTGVDVEVQVDTDEVFNYDRDVKPILEVVISKTIEQGLMEVRQEEELKSISRSKRFLEGKAQARRVEAQQLEKKERQATTAKDKLMAEARKRAEKEHRLQLKLASRVFAHKWLENLQQHSFAQLDERHYFREPVSLAVMEFMPWLTSVTYEKVEEFAKAQEWVDGLVTKALEKGSDEQKVAELERTRARELLEEEERKRKLAEEEKASRAKAIQLYIHTDVVPDSPVGPITLKGTSTVAEIEEEILQWLQENSEDPPPPEKLKFLWNGQTLDKANVLYDLGVENLSTITMELID